MMIMKKKLFLAAIAIGMLASCADNEYVGEVSPNPNAGGDNQAIVFSSGTKALTRADINGADAADLLNKNFVFAGTKSDGTAAPTSFVFDQYTAKYVANTAYTTESNSNDWEYVGQPLAVTSSLGTGATQTIKYWDYSTKQYDFAAYSLGSGTGTTPTYATATAIAVGNKGYTLTGSVDELKACYISDLVTAYNRDGVSDYGKVVTFSFRSLATKIRLAFYETIPGYSVKDVKFYTSSNSTTTKDDGTNENAPTLFTSSTVLPAGSGTMTVTFPTVGWDKSGNASGSTKDTDYNKAHVTFTQASEVPAASTLAFDALQNLAAAESKETAGNLYLGRASNTATYAGGIDATTNTGKYYTILPKEDGANLQLRIKYTLVSTDGSGEEITVNNATAVVPAELAKWSPNYAYTYIFKISDMTNGSTGFDGSDNVITGLTPITLNAVVVDSEDGLQETITTVSEPSITTYTKGKVVTVQSEYSTNAKIYVIVNSGTANEALANKAKLYTVTLASSGETGAGSVAAQTINEASVDNALAHGTYNSTAETYTVKDANKWNLVVKVENGLTIYNKIDAADSPTGNEIVIGDNKVAHFTPTTAGNYVFQYEKAAAIAAVYDNGTTLDADTELYSDNPDDLYYTRSGEEGNYVYTPATSGQKADGSTTYYKETTHPKPAEYQYKIIIVQ